VLDPQAELFPHASPETVLAYCRRLEAKVLEVAPELTPHECQRLLSELTLVTLCMERLSHRIRHDMPYLRRTSLPDVVAIDAARGERIVQPPPTEPPEWPRRRRPWAA